MSGDDTVIGGAGDDVLQGAEGNDAVYGGDGNDAISGGDGDDIVVGGAGNDTLNGDTGINTASYEHSTASVTVNLTSGTASDGMGGTDCLVYIQNVIGSDHADNITGSAGVNVIEGGKGADFLYGVGNNDIYVFREGDLDAQKNMTLAGGDTVRVHGNVDFTSQTAFSGAGTLEVAQAGSMVHFTTAQGASFATVNFAAATSGSTEHVKFHAGAGTPDMGLASVTISGASANDKIYLFGDTQANNFTGSSIADAIYGGDGDDTLTGGAGNDDINGDAGNDVLIGGAGDDNLSGGAGLDTADYTAATTALTINLIGGGATVNAGALGTDVLCGIETIIGGSSDDSISGDTADNLFLGMLGNDTLSGGAGNDTMLGGDGDDVLSGGAGNDLLEGGQGDDTADYSDATTALAIALVSGGATVNAGALGTDTLIGIESLTGGCGNDALTGDEANNVLSGGAGNDTIQGGAGDDSINGGDGNDLLFGGLANASIAGGDGNDSISGGGGNDTVSYEHAIAMRQIDLYGGSTRDSGGTLEDTLSSIENAIGSAFGDRIFGNYGTNVIEGLAGNDTLDGYTDYSGVGDTVSYEHSTASVTVDLANGTASDGFGGTDQLSNFTHILGSAYNDTLTGNAGNNLLIGGLGDDSLFGANGNDTLFGGLGNDNFDGGDGIDTVSYAFSAARVVIDLGDTTSQNTGGPSYDFPPEGFDQILNVENLIGSNFNDSLTGNAENNILTGGAGDDTLDGAGGMDIADYSQATAALTIALQNGSPFSVNAGPLGTDTLSNIEGIIGGSGNDSLSGDMSDNFLVGGAGNDTLFGGLGNDTLMGGSGNDSLDMSATMTRDDQVDGGTGVDTLNFTQVSQSGDEEGDLAGVTGVEIVKLGDAETRLWVSGDTGCSDLGTNLDGSHNYLTIDASGLTGTNALSFSVSDNGAAFTYQLIGGNGADRLGGGDNVDTINGGGGADTLQGGGGADTLQGGGGADVLTGGDGADTFYYYSADDFGDSITDYTAGVDFFSFSVDGSFGWNDTTELQSRLFDDVGSVDGITACLYLDGGNLWYDSNGIETGGATIVAQSVTTLDTDHVNVV